MCVCMCMCVYMCACDMHAWICVCVHEYVHVYMCVCMVHACCVCMHDVCICVYCLCVFARLGGSLLRRQEGLSPPPTFPLSLLVPVIPYSSLTPAFNTCQLVVPQPTSISNSWASLDTDSHERTGFSQLGLRPYVSQQKGPI